jgi:hypothetical protein
MIKLLKITLYPKKIEKYHSNTKEHFSKKKISIFPQIKAKIIFILVIAKK